jgi:hypothetical protein
MKKLKQHFFLNGKPYNELVGSEKHIFDRMFNVIPNIESQLNGNHYINFKSPKILSMDFEYDSTIPDDLLPGILEAFTRAKKEVMMQFF